MLRLALIAALIFAIPAHGQARSYKPGSVGYLYDSCANMLAGGQKLEDVYQTYCAAFLEGYLAGAVITNAVQIPPPRSGDPCEREKTADYARINARLCPHFPDYFGKDATPAFMLTTAAHIAQRWIAFNLKSDPKFLERPAAQTLGDLIQPGAFCDDLARHTAVNIEPVRIDPALLNIEWKSYLRIQDDVTLDRKYAQCKGDLERHATDRKFSFDVSWCGGEIDGFLAGLRTTSKLQENRPAYQNGRCAKESGRLYKSLDTARSMCVRPDTHAMDIARLFVSRYESGIEKDPGFANLKALGAVGYETVYRGFLCVPENGAAASLPSGPASDPMLPMPE